jgi:TPR repeat protein
MLLRLPNPAARLAVLLLSITLAAIPSFFSIRNVRAAHEDGLGTRTGFEAAARLEPSNPENWYLLARYWQYTLDEPDPSRAIANFRRALSLNPRFTDAWLDLGTIYDEGVRFRLSWFSDTHASASTDSQDFRGTQPWTRIEMPWSSGKDVHQLRVCVLRNVSRGFDPRIQGSAWIDDLSLVPVGNPKP